MRGIRITSPEHLLDSGWWALYESAFPATERRGWKQHAAAMQDAAFHCLLLSDDAGFAGLLTFWQWESLTYVEHFAIVPSRRGLGLGHQALQLVPLPAVLEIEPVVNTITARRLSFYESCGYVRLPQVHVQLAYQSGQPDVALWLLSRPALSAAEVEEFEQLFHGGPMRYRDEA